MHQQRVHPSRAGRPGPVAEPPGQYAFLQLDDVDREAIAVEARQRGIGFRQALFLRGRLDERAYVEALAAHLGLSVDDLPDPARMSFGRGAPAAPRVARLDLESGSVLIVAAAELSPSQVARMAMGARRSGWAMRLVTAAVMRRALVQREGARLVRHAVHGLALRDPMSSASAGVSGGQALLLTVACGLLGGGMLVVPWPATIALMAALTLPFAAVVGLRVLALVGALVARAPRHPEPVRAADVAGLPVYTILVPLFREARVLPDLVRALRRLDYPVAKLDIKLILEAADAETRAAAEELELTAPFDVIVVPDAAPRTKPKALNYALSFARGEYVVVYDAEDLPEAGQLTAALAVFRRQGRDLGCVQARLEIDNAGDGWLARQFALEYLALFEGLLPALQWLRLPIPLGGTSNHFRARVLRQVGGWDAFNVTEDADLGIRLARHGYRCHVLASHTYEEAPFRLIAWIKQRTRWLKGWMQTAVVHSREPRRVVRELGPRATLGMHAVMTGIVLSALLHPLCLLVLALQLATGQVFFATGEPVGRAFAMLAAGNLAAGYLATMLLAAVVAIRRRRWTLLAGVPTMPLYWLLISVAAWRALLQMARDPFVWEKTEHGLSRRRQPPRDAQRRR